MLPSVCPLTMRVSAARMETSAPHCKTRLATSGLSVVWVPLKSHPHQPVTGQGFGLGGASRVNQPPGRRGSGMAEDGLDLPFLHHGAFVQDGHPVADLLHHAHLVGNDHHRDTQFPVDLLDQLQDGMGGVGIQGTGGLVTEQDLGIGGQGASNGDALLLTTRELGR